MEKQQPEMEWYYRRKSATKAAYFKNFINIFPQFSGKHPFKYRWWSDSEKKQSSVWPFFLKN